MNLFNTNAHDFRPQRKCFSMTGCLIFVLLMSQASCRPSETDDVPMYNDGDYTDADDIEWQNFPIVETTTKDHPIIYYKEDIVSEDYDPNKENKSSSKEQETEIKPLPRRKYKEISRRNRFNRTENYRYIKPEKVYFDVYPIEDDGIKEEDTKFNENDIHVEVISLLDDNNNNNNNTSESSNSKHILNKRPKKYSRRHRQRRDVSAVEIEAEGAEKHALRHKRNPFTYRRTFYGNQLPQYRGVFFRPVVIYPVDNVKHPIKGPYYNAVSPGSGKPGKRIKTTTSTAAPTDSSTLPDIINRIGEPVWDSSPMRPQRPQTGGRPSISETTVRPSRRPPPPLIHSGDEDYVPSRNQGSASNRSGRPSQQSPTTTPPPFSDLSGSSSSLDAPWMSSQAAASQNIRPSIQTTTVPPPSTSRGISTCIWAISSCCTENRRIRYQCFERLGCSGAFWDLNPCAEDIVRLALEAADQYFV